MKYVLLGASVICLSFTFIRQFDITENNIPTEIAATPDEPGATTGNKGTGVPDVATKALAFKAMLSTTQQSSLQLTYSTSLARKWSNLPCGANCRNGVQFGTFSTAQLAAAQDLIATALSNTTTNNGFAEWEANRMAEAYLHANGGGSGYDSTLRWIAFLNTPSATGSWMLQFGGHHYAANIAFNNGHVVGATPFFEGLEPLSFTYNGKSYAPLTDEHDALAAMLASLSASELATAKLTQTFGDITMSPGETNGGNGTFPITKVGIACSSLTAAQKNLVLAAIRTYVEDMDTATANACMARYTREIDGTYIAFTGNGTAGNAASFLNANSNYVRIDGPTVWVELACQNGIVLSGIHYHTIWRDHSHDYGLDLSGPAIDTTGSGTSSGITSVKAMGSLAVYPNPATNRITVSLKAPVKDATVKLYSVATGQQVIMATHRSGISFDYDLSRMPAGNYILRIEDGSTISTGKFTKL